MAKGDGKRGAAIAVSIGAHIVVLAILALSAPVLRPTVEESAPQFSVTLVRLEPDQRPSATSPSAPRKQTAPPDRAAAAPPSIAPRSQPTPAASIPSAAKPSPAAEPSPAAAAASSAPSPGPTPTGQGRDWRVRPEPGDVHGLVREAIGCGHAQYLKLTTAEQLGCDRKLASLRGADTPHIDLIPAEKRAYYDAVVQKREDERYAAFDRLHEAQLARGIAGMKTHGIDIGASYHCTFKFGAGSGEANKAAGAKLGFPPCPIRAPGADPPPP